MASRLQSEPDDDDDRIITAVNRSSKQLGEREKVIVDADSFSLMQKKNLKSSDITAFLRSRNMAFYTSSCTISELTVHETDMAMALQFAMDARDLGCGHDDSRKSSIECISNFVRDATYTVATKSEILRQNLKMIPDIRFISLDGVDFSLKNYSHQELKPYSLERKRDVKDKGAACELVFVAYDDERYAKFVECDETNNAAWLKEVLSTNCKSERVASVLVDEGFISYGMQHYNSMKLIVKRVSKLLGQQVVFSTTSCAFKKSNPSDHYISTFVNCGHTRPPLPSRDCIFSVVEKPEFGICYVATACDVLKNKLSKVRFVNVLSINDDGKIFLNNLVANEEQEGTSSSLGKAKKQDESEDSGSSGSGDSGGVGQIVGRQTKQYLLQIPTNKVGRVIGVGGFTIRNMQTCSGARMKVIQKQGDTSTVQIVGTSNEIEAAKQMVKLCLETAHKKNRDKKGQEAEDYYNSHFPSSG